MSYSGEGRDPDDQRVWNGTSWVLAKRPLTQSQALTATGNWNGVSDYILVSGAGTKVITLPPPTSVPRHVTLIDADGTSATNTITVVAQGGGTINGLSSLVLDSAFEVLHLAFISTAGSGAWAIVSTTDTVFALSEGFRLNVLPEQADRGSIATTLTDTTSYPLTDGFWYSLTIEIIVEDPTADEQYIYRSVVECFRDGGGAEIHIEAVALEEPAGGNWTITASVNGNNIDVEIDNQAANTVNFARYLGATRKPMP